MQNAELSAPLATEGTLTHALDHSNLDDAAEVAEFDLDLSFQTAAPHHCNAATVADLDEQAKLDLSDWLVSQSHTVSREAKKLLAHGKARQQQAVALLALELALFQTTDWEALLKGRGINPAGIKCRHKMARAVAATFGLDVSVDDAAIAKQASQMIDRLSLAVEWLANKIEGLGVDALQRITFDDGGVGRVVDLLMDHGGINAAAETQRAINNTPEADRDLKIEIDPDDAQRMLVSAGEKALREKAGVSDESMELSVSVVVEIAGKQFPVSLEPKFMDTVKERAFAAATEVDSAVDTLGELLQVGKLVEERETDLPVNNLDDPDAASTTMRLTTRHFVLRSDKSVLISPILAEKLGSPVVIAKPKYLLATPPTRTLWELETRGRRKAEANIADPMRRKFFTSSMGDYEGTQGLARLVLTTAAAGDEAKRAEDVGVLVQPLRSASGNLPLDVSAASFKAEFELTATMLRAMAKDMPSKAKASAKAKNGKAKSASAAELSINGTTGKIELGTKTITFDAQKPSKDGTVRLRGDHLLPIVNTLVGLPLVSLLGIAVDPTGGLRMTFSTKLADYEVYAPALMKDSDLPSNRYFKAIEAK